jgi:hypothetical protein
MRTGAIGLARAQESTGAIRATFSDPSRPGAVKIIHRGGSLTIIGTSRRDVSIDVRMPAKPRQSRGSPPDDSNRAGLRRLTQSRDIVVEESNNEMVVASAARSGGRDLRIEVPTRTDLNLSSWVGGPITVENVEGDIEVHNQGESIALINVSGSVVAYAHDGKLKVTMTRVSAGKAMAFTAFNGDVDVTLPASIKATLKMHTDKDIFTDFDVQVRPAAQPGRESDGRNRIGTERSIEGPVNGGGPPFELRTFNANIYLRKGPQ